MKTSKMETFGKPAECTHLFMNEDTNMSLGACFGLRTKTCSADADTGTPTYSHTHKTSVLSPFECYLSKSAGSLQTAQVGGCYLVGDMQVEV